MTSVEVEAELSKLGPTHLLTFNVDDFNRYARLSLLDPEAVAA